MDNKNLGQLHFERMNRLKPKTVDKAVGPDSAFCCSVCYTDGSESGLVSPVSCDHKICLACYTKITLQHKEKAKCPECRALYMRQSDAVQGQASAVAQATAVQGNQDNNIYADMPPLIDSFNLEALQNLGSNLILMDALTHITRQNNSVLIHYDEFHIPL